MDDGCHGLPLLTIITSSSPARPVSTSPSPHSHSQSPFRYVRLHPTTDQNTSPDDTLLTDLVLSKRQSASTNNHHSPCSDYRSSLSSSPSIPPRPPLAGRPSHFLRQPASSRLATTSGYSRTLHTSYTRPRGLRISNLLRPWIPIILYALTSFGFVIAIACFKSEVFAGLDQLSSWLRSDEQFGHAVLFLLIFLTTFPPVPLYSTLITLSGYTFGPWTGATISYFAALFGGLTVFILSRVFLRDSISRWLASTHAIKRAVYAIEKRPKLLFLIRLAPYPYNVMNCLLAAAPTLTLRTYTLCTALSLFKVIVHTSLGASIHSFRDYHTIAPVGDDGTSGSATATRMWTIIGVALCIVVFVYLFIVARRAVDDELAEDDCANEEETIAFLSPTGHPMMEAPFRTTHLILPPSSPSSSQA